MPPASAQAKTAPSAKTRRFVMGDLLRGKCQQYQNHLPAGSSPTRPLSFCQRVSIPCNVDTLCVVTFNVAMLCGLIGAILAGPLELDGIYVMSHACKTWAKIGRSR